MGRSVASWGPPGGLLGASWGLLEASWGPLGGLLLPGPNEPRGKPMQGPKEALENIFRPLQKSVAKNRVRRAFWQFTIVKHDSFVKLDV